MDELQTQIIGALRELGGETDWVSVSAIAARLCRVSAHDLRTEIEAMVRNGLIWTCELTDTVPVYGKQACEMTLKFAEQNQ